jgi:hypothetical protein
MSSPIQSLTNNTTDSLLAAAAPLDVGAPAASLHRFAAEAEKSGTRSLGERARKPQEREES